MKKVVLLSGGIDSTTCLALTLQKDSQSDVLALNCYYGQKNKREMESARKIAERYGVQLMEFDLSGIFQKSNCPMLSHSTEQIEQRTYLDQTKDTNGEKPISSYVPFRNGLMLSAAIAIAYSVGASEVWYGAHADDAENNAYPDCSEDFVLAMGLASGIGTAGAVHIDAPFKRYRKHEIIRKGIEMNVPYELTWSCYEAGDHPCGKCGTCREIKKAFGMNGMEYPVR